jgi:DNA-binding transcriptional LysR family regulator
MLEPRRLTTLQAVVRAGSFAGAAEELNYTQAAVSQHIAELERAVGLRLLERRPVRPTPAGQLALAAAEAAGNALAAAEAGLRGCATAKQVTSASPRSRPPPPSCSRPRSRSSHAPVPTSK